MSHRALNMELFHGSTHSLSGDTLLPRLRPGLGNSIITRTGGQDIKDVVSASSREEDAWRVAGEARAYGRSRVYRVEPNAETRVGLENPAHPSWATQSPNRVDNSEHVSPQFKVLEQIDIKPGHQGTFPQIDWSRHVASKHQWHTGEQEANHPSPERVAQEMAGPPPPESNDHPALDHYAPRTHEQLPLPFHESRAMEGSPRHAEYMKRWQR